MAFIHKPVMLEEALAALNPVSGGRYVDCTAGGGGHTRAILNQVGPQGAVLGLDQDPDAIKHLTETLSPGAPNLILRKSNYSRLDLVLEELGWETVDGMLLDLGISSHQLEGSQRGFSFSGDEPLDMRMNPDEGRPAHELVNRLPEKELADLIFNLGGERGSRRVARGIVWARQKQPIETAAQLAKVVRKSLWRPGKPPKIDPATRTFQALRMAVNRELENLEEFLSKAPGLLSIGGRMAVISFHSLEDRLIKQAMVRRKKYEKADESGGPVLEALFKKPLQPSEEETAANPRARSAKLRAGVRAS